MKIFAAIILLALLLDLGYQWRQEAKQREDCEAGGGRIIENDAGVTACIVVLGPLP